MADLIPKFTDVPWSAWLDLARVFISEFGPADVVHEGDADQT